MSDCEWMFEDAGSGALGIQAMAPLNPFRWSGSLSFEKAISALEEELSKGSRPILLKVPSGVSTPSKRFETTEDALAYLRKVDPAEIARKEAEILRRQQADTQAKDAVKAATEAKDAALKAVKAATEAKDTAESAAAAAREEASANETLLAQAKAAAAAAGNDARQATGALGDAQSGVKCEWMFGDAGIKTAGFQWAKLNPLRWSGGLSVTQGIQQLKDVQQQTEAVIREILVRVPPGPSGKEQRFGSCDEAILYLESVCPARNKAREDCDAASVAHKAAEDKIPEAEAGVAETKRKLDNIMVAVSEAEETLKSANVKLSEAEQSLESANTHAAKAKADLDEFSNAA